MEATFCQRFGSFFLASVVVFKLAIFTTSMGQAPMDDGEIRFLEGNETAGRVEAFLGGMWRTVCDDFWDFNNALVVCRQRGFKGSYDTILGDMETRRTGGFVNLFCDGIEQTIIDCEYSLVNYCMYEDAVVSCRTYDLGDARITGANGTSGLVEVYFDMSWVAVCSDGWDLTDADVLCRQLGLIEAVWAFEDTETESDVFYLSQVDCFGNEDELLDCAYTASQDCQTNSYASVACKVPENGMVRLVGGSDVFSGRLEIFLKGEWGSVCDDNWDLADANVVCRQLGYGNAFQYPTESFRFGAGTGPILLCCLDCHGNETDLLSCPRSADNICHDTEDAGVVCELSNSVFEEGHIRFIDGNATAGRVEAFLDAKWQTLCGDYWNFNNALVVCRQLGFKGAYEIIPDRRETHRTAVFTDLFCGGIENTILDCQYNLENLCIYEDAVVSCISFGGCKINVPYLNRTVDLTCTWTVEHVFEQNVDHGDVRFVGGNTTSGLVEVYFERQWVAVCSDEWDLTDAQVLCRQLGFMDAVWVFGDTETESDIFHLNQVTCFGNEEELLDCAYTTSPDCQTNSYASVVCKAPENGMVRLVGGSDMFSGRLEIFLRGEWGSVCDDDWDLADANVVCRQLGYGNAFQYTTESFPFGAGTGPILSCCLDCHGNEADLLSCARSADNICHHTEDAGVICEQSNSVFEEGHIRFIDGNATAGRVEAFLDAKWQTLCGDYWNFNNALVVCRQLGFKGAYEIIPDRRETHRTAVFTDLFCGGIENTILDCQYNLENLCIYEDAVVSCISFGGCKINVPYLNRTVDLTCTWTVEHVFEQNVDHGDVRFVGGNTTSGLVEVYFERQWVAVCSDEWDLTDAQVLCRQLGFMDAVWVFGDTETESDIFHLNQVTCFGNEEELLDCAYTTSPDCQTNSYASVVCKAPENGMVRLVGGSDMFSGRLEIFLRGEWGSVCDDDWDLADANVVCRQLGYGNAFQYTTESFPFGAGTGPILSCCLDCHGNEADLLSCARSADNICHHTEDAGVICEQSNSVFEEGHIRFIDGNATAGRVEAFLDAKWQTLCGDYWNFNNALVVCRQLGFKGAYEIIPDRRETHRTAVFTDLFCGGIENTILDCQYNLENLCIYEDAVVSCISFDHGDVRIVGGSTTSGRVEVYFEMQWVAVCSDEWDLTDADVLCRQLGFIDAVWVFEDTETESDMFYLSHVDCSGNEEELLGCAYTTSQDCQTISYASVACKAPENGMVRLVGGSDVFSGRLEIFLKGEWGSVCDDDWDLADANVVCRQLGYGNALRHTVGSFPFGAGTGPILSCCLDCHGNEADLKSCARTADYICPHTDDAGVVCELSNFARDFPVRLMGAIGNPYSGRVEVLVEGQWGTICDDQWDIRDANVVCRQLGFGIAVEAETHASFGQGTGPIAFTQLHCNGTETNLWDCPEHLGIGSGNVDCSHTEDAGVICSGACVVAECPLDVQTTLETGSDTIDVSWVEPSSVDSPCGTVSFTSSHSPGDRFQEGDTIVSYRFVDTSGAQDSCNFTVKVAFAARERAGIHVVAVIIPSCAFVALIVSVFLLRWFKVPKGLWERSLPPLPNSTTPSKSPAFIHSEDSCSDNEYIAVEDDNDSNIYAMVGASSKVKNDVTANEKSQSTISKQVINHSLFEDQDRNFKGSSDHSTIPSGNFYMSDNGPFVREKDDRQKDTAYELPINDKVDSKTESLYACNIEGDIIQKEPPIYFEHDPNAGVDIQDEESNDDAFASQDDRGQHNSQSTEVCNASEVQEVGNGDKLKEDDKDISTRMITDDDNSVKDSEIK